MTKILIWLGLSVAVGVWAGKKNRNGFGWGVLSIVISPVIAGAILYFLQDRTQNINPKPLTNDDGKPVEAGDTLKSIKDKLVAKNIYLSEESINNKPAVIGYEKKFKLKWMATQLNTFVVAVDFADNTVTEQSIDKFLAWSFKYAKKNYRGWPRGLQSGLAVIGILISKNIDQSAITYCQKLKAGKKYSGFAIPVTLDPSSNETYYFNKKPMWGKIYYPHFEKMINDLT